jgi:hypothetical protein
MVLRARQASILLLAAAAPAEPIRVSMRNVVLHPYDDVAAAVGALQGTVLPERPGTPVSMNDVTSYRIAVDYETMRLSAEALTRLMNQHILPRAHTPITHVEVSFKENAIGMSGTLVKLGLPVPFTATATVSATPNGELRVHVTDMQAAGFIPKGLTDALGLELSVLAQPRNRAMFRIKGDDLLVPVASMFPPPRFTGWLSAVSVSPAGLDATIGHPAPLTTPPVKARSFIYFKGGTLRFAKLAMRDTDMVVLPSAGETLAFSPAHYYAQLEAGRTEALPGFALAAYVKSYETLVPTAAKPPPGTADTPPPNAQTR